MAPTSGLLSLNAREVLVGVVGEGRSSEKWTEDDAVSVGEGGVRAEE